MNHFFQRQKRASGRGRRAGFVSIEVIIVLVVVIVLAGIAMSKSDILTNNSAANEEIGNIQAIVTASKNLKTTAGYGTAGTDLTSQLLTQGDLPKNISVVGGVMQNPSGGTYVVLSTGGGFTVATSNLPAKLCSKTVPKLSKYQAFSNTSVNGTANAGEVTPSAAGTQCGAGGATVTYTVAS